MVNLRERVGNILPQNEFLPEQLPTYGIGSGGDSDSFEIYGTVLKLKTIPNITTKTSYVVNVTSTIPFGPTAHRIFNITVEMPPDGFITTWQTTIPYEHISIPVGIESGTYTVDWGDGSIVTGVLGSEWHQYENPGIYKIRIYGNITGFHLNGGSQCRKTAIDSPVGRHQMVQFELGFQGCKKHGV